MNENTNWRFYSKAKKTLLIKEIDEEMGEITAIDVEVGMPVILDIAEDFSINEIEVGKTYQATIAAYRGELTPEIDNLFEEIGEDNPRIRQATEHIRTRGGQEPLWKFKLLSIE